VILRCATSNPGKLREFRLAGAVEPLPNLRDLEPPEESGDTFEANAIEKALYYGAHTPDWLFAEDSGLEVDALSGAPGVYSARFAGPGARKADWNNGPACSVRMCDCAGARGQPGSNISRRGERRDRSGAARSKWIRVRSTFLLCAVRLHLRGSGCGSEDESESQGPSVAMFIRILAKARVTAGAHSVTSRGMAHCCSARTLLT
jgi:hypothetical protein